jgi:type IV pilus assembly protein PilQ
MGEVVKSRQRAGWQLLAVSALTLALPGWGCSSSKPAKVVEAAPAAREKPAPAEAKPAPAPAEIRAVDLREGAPEFFVDLDASAPLVWTSFRNADGRVVVELPNSVPRPGLADLAPESGLVSSLKIEKSDEGLRPVTRLIIATRQEVEHSVTANGTKMEVTLTPVEQTASTGKKDGLAFEPLPEDRQQAAPPAAPAASGAAPAGQTPAGGTPDRPAVAPAPAGAAASHLESVETVASDPSGTIVRLNGDGEFAYSTFVLDAPRRFVIDLDGVVNRSPKSTLTVPGAGPVDRVRVAQFRPPPKAVARVVFDLRDGATPTIERAGQALVVSFGGMSGSGKSAPAPSISASAPPPPKPAAEKGAGGRKGSEPPLQQPAVVESEDASPMPAAPKPAGKAAAAKAPASISVAPKRPPTNKTGTPSSPAQTFVAKDFPSGLPSEQMPDGEPIDLKVTNAEVTDVLRTFSQISGLNMMIQPGVSGLVTAELTNVPWNKALDEVLKVNNLGYEIDGNIMRIAPTDTLKKEAQDRQQLNAAKALAIPLRTVYKRLSYAKAPQVAGVLRTGQSGLLSQRGSVVVDERTNALIIKELPNNMDSVLSVVDLLDAPEPQVMIEARIIETTKRFTRDLGINWGFNALSDAAHGNTTGLVFPAQGTANGTTNTAPGATNGTLDIKLGNLLNTFTLDAKLRAAESEGLITILSAPKVATLNNQRASIQSGLQIPIQTVLNGTVTVQFIDATLRLDVTPQVTAEGTVLMDIDIAKREPQLAFLIPGATNAPIATKDARTRMVVRDGGTAVIGGIYKVSSDNGENRVPGLSNIPLIGNLFKGKTRSDENEELLIFITPRVIKI